MIAKRTTMMPIDNLLDASLAKDMATASNITIVDLIETNGALKLIFEYFNRHFKGVLLNFHLVVCKFNINLL
jgi:hypothetical protein